MKKRARFLILLGLLGAIFVVTIDMIMGKPVNDFSGPKSTSALVACGLLIFAGSILLLKKNGCKKQ